jgi:methylmalonyl-CoA mutase
MSSKKTEFQQTNLDAWHQAAAKSAPGGKVEALNWLTPDGITVKPLYTAADTKELPHADTLPGFEPYLRGPQATMYAVWPWTIRQYAGFHRRGVQRLLRGAYAGARVSVPSTATHRGLRQRPSA